MRKLLAGAAVAAMALLASAPAFAQWGGPGFSVGFGFGPSYGYDYDYGPGYDWGGGAYYGGPYYDGGYVAVPRERVYEGRSVAIDRGDSVAFCESHFRSYNPATGEYLGYDGMYHHCP